MTKTVALIALGWCCWAASAQVPLREQVDRDLAGPFATRRAEPNLSRKGQLCDRTAKVILKQGRYLVSRLHPWKDDPAALLLTDGNHGEHGIRPNAHTAWGLAFCYRCLPTSAGYPDGLSPQIAREKAIAILRFLLPTHGAGGKLCSDGKPWRDQWQSAHWASSAGRAAWFLWDDLDPDLKWLAARMICDEADRFLDREPDHQVVSDTKAEENAWNSEIIALAFNMFPQHPHHGAWGKAAIRWQLSAFATDADTRRTDLVDGAPVNQWIQFPNIYDDYTLENHDRVHPDYMTTIILNIHQKLLYDWADNKPPQSILFNVDKVYASLKKLTLPDGGYLYPNAQDWQLHRCPDWFDCHAVMSCLFNDPQAARLARICLTTAEKMIARSETGGIYAADETRFPSSQAMLFDLYSRAYLMMAQEGEGPPPVSETQLWQQLAGRHVFTYGKFGVLRTDHSASSFSWGRQVMGMVLPLQKDLLLTPNDRGLIGMVTIPGLKREAPDVKRADVIDLSNVPGALAVCGVLERGKGAIEQPFAFVALPDGRTIYADSPRLTGSVMPSAVELGTLGVLNDKHWVYHDGRRTLYFEGGQKTFLATGATTDAPARLRSSWYNLDDALGILVLSSSGQQLYIPRPTGAASRLEQLFHLNHPNSPAELKPTVLVFYPSQGSAQTRAAANQCQLEAAGAGKFTIRLDDAMHVRIDLAAGKIAVAPK